MNKKLKTLLNFLSKWIEDILILSGLTFIVGTTFLLSKIAGGYMLGAVLIGMGVYFIKCPLKGSDKK
jgi:uncharacterized membrane protein AbrB (regulator of aidB expression)